MTNPMEYEFAKQQELLSQMKKERERLFLIRDAAQKTARKDCRHGWTNLSALLLGIVPLHEKKHWFYGRGGRHCTGNVPARHRTF